MVEALARDPLGLGCGSCYGSRFFSVRGEFLGLKVFGTSRGLGLSGLVVKSGCYENLAKDPSVLGRGFR